MKIKHIGLGFLWACGGLVAGANPMHTDNAVGIDWQRVGTFEMARTETTVGQFRRYVQARGVQTLAERNGGGQVFEAGWVVKPGWNWRTPFGPQHSAADSEPAVHITYGEAQAFCRWAGGQLPTDAQWLAAAYTEQRPSPPAPFERNRRYEWPSGAAVAGAQCLDECGPQAAQRAVRHGAALARGPGHARVGTTPAGVNGLHDMGGNAWEWVNEPVLADADVAGSTERRTRGGSWWYGAGQMRADYLQSKPAQTAVVYIGFRCARDAGSAK
jgi:formylglycine-generating enzyme